MTAVRKSAQAREKDLRLAIHRIEVGRAHTKATSLNVSTVAREAGVSPALIHNYYPAVAETIRAKAGASSRQQRDRKHEELKKERFRARELRDELAQAHRHVQQLVSINETLLLKLRALEARATTNNIVDIRVKAR